MKKKFIMIITVLMLGFGTFVQATPSLATVYYQQHLKKDGTPDKRYKENKHLKKDGTPDKRFKENKKAAPHKKK